MIREIKEIEKKYGGQLSPRARFSYAVLAMDVDVHTVDGRELAKLAGIGKSSCYAYLKEEQAAQTVLN